MSPYVNYKPCRLDGCEGMVKARGLCNRHYIREVRRAEATADRTGDEPRLWRQIDAAGPCWLWTGSLNAGGYGYVTWGRGTSLTHRLVWTLLVGDIPDGLVLDHLCRVRHCCNPDHLEPVTIQENLRRGIRGGTKPRCPKGHRYDIFIERRGGIERRCSVCERVKRRARTIREAARRRGEAA